MIPDADKADIEAVLRSVRQGHYDKDPAAIGAQFAPEAVIFDLAPPLGHKLDGPGLAAWLDTWDGPGTWKIVHEHTSVPFHMDGSFRAATDLTPELTDAR
jgi:hypothetical protein